MNYNIVLTDNFKKEAKKLIKRYASLAKELAELGAELQKNPTTGTPLGNDVYKIRIAIASKNKGKSGGARIISCVKVIDENVYLLTIYNKGEKDNISDKEIQDILINEDI
jgi:mRNA-degrading endonuclease RelE of RelBE toxin-antitoxin system